MAEKPQSPISVIKEQFAVLGVLVVLIGTVYTDYYYASFGLRYQSLNLPASHIIYRGLTVLRDAPYVALPYLVAVLWLVIDSGAKHPWLVSNRTAISYTVIASVLFLSYWLASIAGSRSAATDLSTSSTLPRIKQLVSSVEGKFPCETADACRLLLIDGDYLYVFTPTDKKSSIPNVIRLDKKAFNEISTGTQ